MKFGINLRNWGPNATPATLLACAQAADASTLDSIWLNDHVALPSGDWNNEYGIPDDMGDILDPFSCLAFLAGVTSRIALGTGVLIVPYRPALLTAKWIASIQVLSHERFLMGVGPGYLAQEFTALGVVKAKRGRITDETLAFVREAFASEELVSNGQAVRFRPQPALPPIYIGGSPEVALARAVRVGDGWIPVGILPDALAPHVARLREMADAAGRGRLDVVIMKTLPLADRAQALELAEAYAAAGVDHLVHTQGYDGATQYADVIAQVSEEIQARFR